MVTTTISTIGTGGTYADITTWEQATDIDLTASTGTIHVGELLNQAHAQSTAVTMTGATTSATTYRILRAQAGAEYDPITGLGARITHSGAGHALVIAEEGFQVSGIGILWTKDVPTTVNAGIRVTADATNSNALACRIEDVYIKAAFTTSIVTTYGIHVVSDAAYPANIRKCVIVGTAVSTTGLNVGIYLDHATVLSTVQNCVVYRAQVTGIETTANKANVLTNNVCAESVTTDYVFGGALCIPTYCASDDATADDNTGAGNVVNIAPERAFTDPRHNDFHPRTGGGLAGAGIQQNSSFTTDLESVTWEQVWHIGAYTTAETASPLTRSHSIGTGGDYTTIPLWEADTDNDLVTFDVIESGVLVNEAHAQAATTTFAGATTDATRYRTLAVASGGQYDPVAATGTKITHSAAGHPINIAEEGFQASGFGIIWTVGVPTTVNAAIHVSADGTNSNAVGITLEDIFIDAAFTASIVTTYGIHGKSDAAYALDIRNCIVVGTAVSTTGLNIGIFLDHATVASEVSNCVVYKAQVNGIDLTADIAHVVKNCVSAAAVTADFIVGGVKNILSYNASDDATADDGTNPDNTGEVINITPASEFQSPDDDDFRLLTTGSLWKAGTDLSADSTTDITGDTWDGHWNIGAYRANALQFLGGLTWYRFDATTAQPGADVAYYRLRQWRGTNVSDAIRAAGYSYAIAYLGEVTSGIMDEGTALLDIATAPIAAASASLTTVNIDSFTGTSVMSGAPHGTDATLNTAAFRLNPSADIKVACTAVHANDTAVYDIILELHR